MTVLRWPPPTARGRRDSLLHPGDEELAGLTIDPVRGGTDLDVEGSGRREAVGVLDGGSRADEEPPALSRLDRTERLLAGSPLRARDCANDAAISNQLDAANRVARMQLRRDRETQRIAIFGAEHRTGEPALGTRSSRPLVTNDRPTFSPRHQAS